MKINLMMMVTVAALALTGCKTGYQWTSKVPENMRTVSVPNFRNQSSVTELGNVVQRQLLREFQREGTFRICSSDDAAIEIQGEIASAGSLFSARDRRSSQRYAGYMFTVTARVSIIDKRLHKVLVDDRTYRAMVPVTITGDLQTAERDASGRAADDLARQVVDDVVGMPW